MTGSFHEQVKALFLEASALDEAQRARLLEAHASQDAAVADEVRKLFELPERDLGAAFVEPGLGSEPGPRTFAPGAHIGPYVLLEKVGEGGFGTVWAADQRAPIRRKVALKVLKAGMDSRQVLTRFEAERNALGMMDHAHIARVYDSGETTEGRPYFVMEYVEGIPITAFCDTEELTIEERIRLYLDVCAAVQHAHQKGIVHRDLKPSNILVALREGRPHAKVIDFGIAKATSQALTEHTLHTLQGQLIGTPEYMSPEQAQMSGVGIDSTTDIYSLGVVLYELLTGVLPFDPVVLRSRGLAEIHRILRDEEPSKPSTRVSTLGEASTEVGRARRIDSRRLKSELSGDLDWIVMRAMEKQRARRYPSASELAADLRRYLAHEPVLAGPPSALYRIRKFVRRNRVAVAFAGMASVLLIAGILGTTVAMLEAKGERAKAEAARIDAEEARRLAETRREEADRARALAVEHSEEAEAQRVEAERSREQAEQSLERAVAEQERAKAVTDFLLDTLGLADPNVTQLPQMSMAVALDQAAAQVGAAFARYPENEAQVQFVIGRAYDTLGRPERALPHLRRALFLYQRVLDPEPFLEFQCLVELYAASKHVGDSSWVDLARAAYQSALGILAEGEPPMAGEFGVLLLQANMGTVPVAQIRETWNGLRERSREVVLAPPEATVQVLSYLLSASAATLGWRSNSNEAAEMYEELLAEVGQELPHRVRTRMTEDGIYLRLLAGDHEGGERRIRAELEHLSKLLGDGHAYLEIYRSMLGECLFETGRVEEARQILEQSLAVLEEFSHRDHYQTGLTRIRLARLYEATGRQELAAIQRRALIDSVLAWPGLIQWLTVKSSMPSRYAELMEAIDELDRRLVGSMRLLGLRSGSAEAIAEIVERIIEVRRRLCPDEELEAWVFGAQLGARGEELLRLPGLHSAGLALLFDSYRTGLIHGDRQPLLRLGLFGALHHALRQAGELERAAGVAASIDDSLPAAWPVAGDWTGIPASTANEVIWALVRSPGLAATTYLRLVEFSSSMIENSPEVAESINTAGIALYRAGRFKEALETLSTSDRLHRSASGDEEFVGDPVDLAFLAMAADKLGQRDEAAVHLSRLEKAMEQPRSAKDPDKQAFLAEARAALSSRR